MNRIYRNKAAPGRHPNSKELLSCKVNTSRRPSSHDIRQSSFVLTSILPAKLAMSKYKLQKHIIAHKISAMLKDSRVIFIFHYNNVKTKSWNQLKKELFKLRATCLSTARFDPGNQSKMCKSVVPNRIRPKWNT